MLVSPVFADRDMPPADRSTRDGYAVRSADLGSPPVVLRVCGEVAAGSDAAPPVGRDECVRVFTGGNVPPDADTIIMLEDTEPAGEGPAGEEMVRILRPSKKGSHISIRGEIARRDDELLPAGTFLNAMAIATCAAVGVSSLEVHPRPAVSVLATGTELRKTGKETRPHETRNSNGPMLAAALGRWGYRVASSSYVTDEAELIAEYLRTALERSDLVVMTGGTSVGKYDVVAGAIGLAGGRIHFRGIHMSPGRPTLFATTSEGRYIFGLPGNPISAMTGFHEFVLPLMRRLAGLPAGSCRTSIRVRLAEQVAGRAGRQRLVPGRLVSGPGGMTAEIIGSSGAADLVAGSKADGVIIVPPDTDRLAAGSLCDFRMWK
jgi:molybdopterin molybdotransferase